MLPFSAHRPILNSIEISLEIVLANDDDNTYFWSARRGSLKTLFVYLESLTIFWIHFWEYEDFHETNTFLHRIVVCGTVKMHAKHVRYANELQSIRYTANENFTRRQYNGIEAYGMINVNSTRKCHPMTMYDVSNYMLSCSLHFHMTPSQRNIIIWKNRKVNESKLPERPVPVEGNLNWNTSTTALPLGRKTDQEATRLTRYCTAFRCVADAHISDVLVRAQQTFEYRAVAQFERAKEYERWWRELENNEFLVSGNECSESGTASWNWIRVSCMFMY